MKAARKQRLAKLNRQLTILERRYGKALLRARRAIGRRIKTPDITAAAVVIGDAHIDLVSLVEVWTRRAMHLYGKENIDYLLVRVGKKSIELKSAFDVFQAVAEEWLKQYALDQATRIGSAMLQTARDSLARSREEGVGSDVAARRLQKAVGGTFSDAQRIARTEMHTAAGRADNASARSTGLDMVKEWGATDDKRTRESHAEADGQRREMEEAFDVGGSKLMFPGDENGPAHEIINCRCSALYHPRINGVVYD